MPPYLALYEKKPQKSRTNKREVFGIKISRPESSKAAVDSSLDKIMDYALLCVDSILLTGVSPSTMNQSKTMTATLVAGKRAKNVVSLRKNPGSLGGFYTTAFRKFLHSVSPRALAIASARYGAGGKKPMTLEEIGQTYGITRERVRQIISVLLENVRAKRYPAALEEVSKKIEWTLKKRSGILEKEAFFSAIAKDDAKEQGAVRFFLAVLPERFRKFESDVLVPSIALASFSYEAWRTVNENAKHLFVENGASLAEAELLKRLGKIPALKAYSQETLLDFLAVSRECRRNPFWAMGTSRMERYLPAGNTRTGVFDCPK
jgi:hypothetical protein